MAANPEIYFEHDRLGHALAWSAGLHVGVTAALLFYSAIAARTGGSTWGSGGGGEAIGATLVSTVPLPAKPADAKNVLANESKDRKSTRLNSSHANISYAVFCLKKKKQKQTETR